MKRCDHKVPQLFGQMDCSVENVRYEEDDPPAEFSWLACLIAGQFELA